MPDKTMELKGQLKDWQKETGALFPVKNKDFSE